MARTASGLLVPNHVTRNDIAETETARALMLEMVQRTEGQLRYWTEVAQRELNDPRVFFVRADPGADPESELTPNFYHLIRDNEPPTPPSVIPVEKDGQFAEPGQWFIDRMRAADLQNPRVMRAHREAKRQAELAKQREHERETEERREHLRDAYNARFRTSISLNRDTPWTQTASAKRDRKKSK